MRSPWPQVCVMQSTTVTKTIEALRQMFAMYGLNTLSQNDPQFTADDFELFLKRNGLRHTRTAPYHPATNGLAERFVVTEARAQGKLIIWTASVAATQQLPTVI